MRAELFIDGQWRFGRGAPLTSQDPATNETVWSGAIALTDDVTDAFAAARRAFPAWARRPLDERISVVRAYAKAVEARAGVFAEMIARETGKVLWDCKGEVAAVIGKIEISINAQAERAGHRDDPAPFGAMTLDHRPHGVMAVFGPFNFPAHLPNGHVVPALLAGDTVVFKPSELAPGVASVMMECWEAAGLPPGVVNMVQGGRDVGGALLANPEVNGVLFTGSAHAGQHIHRHFAGRPDIVLALELGGNNPLIAWPPADVAATANLIAHSAFATSGQRCSCARRLIVPDDAWGREVIDALKALAGAITVGAWNAQPEPFMGPLVRAHAAESAEKFVGALIARGGAEIEPFAREGAFVRPTIIDMTAADGAEDEELFGPVLQVWRVRTFDEALERANATRFGLAGGLISDDAALWERVHIELRAGVLNWNRPTTGASGAMPFGGPGLSGSARPSASYAADYCAYPVSTQRAEKAVAIPAPGLPQGSAK
ncbi:MAG: succinylglutamate-semialdehyde dehydrogenase [Alphaproteobacteria bacterium]|nr:succinylglutamate-semialdehyde dehydrogenase [Alphaproteobacteria bacterium]